MDISVDITAHILVPKHSKMSMEEANALLEKLNISINQLPKILKSDPAIHNLNAEVGDIILTILPPDVQEFTIKFNKIWIEKPQITEADGSRRNIYPIEARMRKLTYAAPIYLEVSAFIDGIQRESFVSQIGKIPIMLRSKYCHMIGIFPI